MSVWKMVVDKVFHMTDNMFLMADKIMLPVDAVRLTNELKRTPYDYIEYEYASTGPKHMSS